MDIGTLTGTIELEDQLTGKLRSLNATVWKFVDNYGGALATAAFSTAALTTAVAGAVVSIVNLGQKGSTILGVEDAFNRLAVAAGSTGDAMFGALNQGVRGTVDSMELMQGTTRLLSSGLKITEADLKLMAQTAREVGKASGTDAAQGLNILSTAMISGNARALKRYGIQIDLIAAEKEFRASVGGTTAELSAAGKLEVNRIAVLAGMKTKLDALGESEISFKERIQQAGVAVGNWFDDLAKGVAKSSAVNAAFSSISESVSKAFGGTAQTVLQTLLGWVDKFASSAASAAPRVIGAIVSIKNTIVDIWNWLVAFNTRWQITSNLVAGAKMAWSVLEKAFYLVKDAVQAVIRAWSEMPEWLQRITRVALESTLALSAYSAAIGATAAPFSALIGAVDLGINIIGNLTGAIYSSLALWPKLSAQITITTAAYGRHTAALRASTIAQAAEAFATQSVIYAKQTLAFTSVLVTSAIERLAVRTGVITLALKGYVGWISLTTAAKALWSGAIHTVTLAYTGLLTRLGLMTLALRAQTAAVIAGKLAMEAFGFVILGIQALPLIAAIGGIVFGMKKLWDMQVNLQQAYAEGKTTWDFLSAKDSNTWARRWINYFTQFAFGADLFETSANKIDTAGKKIHKGMMAPREFQPTISPGYISGGAAAAKARDEASNALVAPSEKAAMFVDTMSEKIKTLQKSWAEAGMSSKIFRAAFASLSEEQRKNYDVQQLLLPEIQKLTNSHQQLTPEMIELSNSVMDTRLAYIEKDKAMLASIGVTEGQIDQMKRLGMSELDIATQYGVSTEALQLRIAAMQEAATRQEALASFENALVEQQAGDQRRREATALAANKAIAASHEELTDLIQQQTMTATEYQIQKIKEQEAASIATFSASGASTQAIEEFTETAMALSDRRVAALMVDEDALRTYSRRTLQDQASKARATYLEMTKYPELYSERTIKQFKNIAEEAEHSANGTRSAWSKAFEALDHASNIAGVLPGKFGEIASAAVDAARSIAEGFAQGGIIGGAMAGITAGIKAIVGLFGETDYEKRTKAAAKEMKSLTAEAVKTAGSMERLAFNAHRVGINIQAAFASRDPEFLKEVLEDVEQRTNDLNSAMQEYGLTWAHLGDEFRTTALADQFDVLYEKTKRLQGVGIEFDTIIVRQADDYNDMISSAIRSNTKMPASMRPIIESLIRMGKLTRENANLMLGLADDTVPSLDDIRGAAERYGITLDSLGGKVKQLEITELAEQYVADWEILTRASDNWGVIIDAMAPKIQSLVTDALKYGSELPLSMKPMLQAFADAGKLVDLNDQKLTDLTKLNWQIPIEDMFETLIMKLDEFIDRIGDAASGLAGLGKIPSGIASTENRGEIEYEDPSYYARGGKVIAFQPRGTDTVPAMLTPGERVIPRGGEGGGTVIVELDRRRFAEILVPEIPGAVKRLGIR